MTYRAIRCSCGKPLRADEGHIEAGENRDGIFRVCCPSCGLNAHYANYTEDDIGIGVDEEGFQDMVLKSPEDGAVHTFDMDGVTITLFTSAGIMDER